MVTSRGAPVYHGVTRSELRHNKGRDLIRVGIGLEIGPARQLRGYNWTNITRVRTRLQVYVHGSAVYAHVFEEVNVCV